MYLQLVVFKVSSIKNTILNCVLFNRNTKRQNNERKKKTVRCGIRTHAPFRESELKSDALDRSANLTMEKRVRSIE